MRLIHIEKTTANMQLARPIYQKNSSNILLNAGCTNLLPYKNKLSELGIHYIYIEDEISEGIEINDAVSEKTRTKSRKILQAAINNVARGKNINVTQIKDVVEDMLNDILQNKNILLSLSDIRTIDEYTFSHSVNVAVLALILGNSLGYDKYSLQKLGMGALLHDIGKAKIPGEIINKPGKLTEEEYNAIKEHPQLGYDAIKHNWEISPLARTIILCHHEKLDGSGYPRHISGSNIHEFARIVAICDVFDALTAERCYSPKWAVYETIEYLLQHAGTHFDQRLVERFVEHIATYPNGSLVTLSDGRNGIIFAQNTTHPTRPIIKILEESNEKLPSNAYYTINLLEHHSINIIDHLTPLKA